MKRKHRKAHFIFVGISLAMPSIAFAETELETISVETARIEKPINGIPGTITILDQEQIEQQTIIADDLPSILENTVPGFGPSLQKMTGRGESFRGRNPLYMIDGVPQHNALRDGQRDGHTIDIDFIEKIEVVHGANAIQGIGATGGVVGLITKSAKKTGKWENTVKTSFTTSDEFTNSGLGYKVSWFGGIATDKYDIGTGVAVNHRGMFYDGNGKLVGLYPTQGDIMDSGSRDFFLKAGYQLTDKQHIKLMVNNFQIERDADFRSKDGDPKKGIPTSSVKGKPVDVGDPAKNDVTTFTVGYRNDGLLGGAFNAQLYHQDYAALFEGGFFGDFFRLTPDGDPFLDQSEIRSKKLGLKLTQSWKSIGGIKGLAPTVGLDFQQDKSSQVLVKSGRQWVPETSLEGTAPFAQLDYAFSKRITGTVGVRHEMATLKTDDYTTIAAANSTKVAGGSPDYSETLANVGLSFKATDKLTLYTSFSEGFTMPDVGRVLRGIKTPGQDVDRIIDLKPIVTENKEIGLDFNFDRSSIHLAYYLSDSDLGSRLDKDDNGIFHVRREKTEIEGWEISADVDVTDTMLVGFNYTNIKGQFDSDKDGKVDADLDGLSIAPDRINLFAEKELNHNIRGRVQVAHLMDRKFKNPDPDDAGFEFKGYTTADLSLAAKTRFGDFSLGVDNLFDKQYITYFSQAQKRKRANAFFSGTGRTLTLGYKVDF